MRFRLELSLYLALPVFRAVAEFKLAGLCKMLFRLELSLFLGLLVFVKCQFRLELSLYLGLPVF